MYKPQPINTTSTEKLASSLQAELNRLAIEFSQPSDYISLKTIYAEPDRIFDGMMVKADGTTWNPGAGAGVYTRVGSSWVPFGVEAFPVGSIFISAVSTNPASLLFYGTWAAFGTGRVLIGYNAADTDFNAAEKTGGAKTKAISAHSGTAVADHASHTHSVTSNATVADHASHTHNYTDVPDHVHKHIIRGGTTASTTGTNVMASDATGGNNRWMAIDTSNPTGGVTTGVTAGPNTTLSHTVTNNAVTSGGPSATLTHTVTQPSAHTDLNVLPPYITVYMWKRTA